MSEDLATNKETPELTPTPQGPVSSQVLNPVKTSQYLLDMLTLPEHK
jgi:hypothetical protein